ncbi:MAG: hypothetical protein ACPG8V_03650 [Alphaproteobacteria bacterium]
MGGGYFFTPKQGNAQNVIGYRLRTEYRLNNVGGMKSGSKFIVGLEFQEDNVRDKQTILSFKLSYPFGSYAKRQELEKNYYSTRVFEPIVRDIDIVTGNNVLHEEALDSKTNKPIKKISYVSNQKELAEAVLGDKKQIIVITKSFDTGSRLRLADGQIIVSGDEKIQFKTSSGNTGSYQPASGEKKTIRAKHKANKAVIVSDYKNVRGVYLYSKNHKGELIREDKSLLGGVNQTVKTGDKVKGVFDSTGSKDTKSYSLICSDGGDLFTTGKCDNSLSINSSTGEITVARNFTGMPVRIFKVVMTNSDGSKAQSERNIFMSVGVENVGDQKRAQHIPNNEIYRGIRLVYGNKFKCGNDNAADSGVTACDTSKKTKLQHVKNTIDAILDKIGEKNGKAISDKIEYALRHNDATMSMFNNGDDKTDGMMAAVTFKGGIQDLQASETISSATNTSGGQGTSNKNDATLEEILHLIQNYGISQVKPEWQDRISAIMEKNMSKVKYTDANNDGHDDGGDSLPYADLNTEYFAGSLEAYFNIHSREVNVKKSTVCTTGSSGNCSGGNTSRADLKRNHREMYDLIESMFGSGDKFWK